MNNVQAYQVDSWRWQLTDATYDVFRDELSDDDLLSLGLCEMTVDGDSIKDIFCHPDKDSFHGGGCGGDFIQYNGKLFKFDGELEGRTKYGDYVAEINEGWYDHPKAMRY